MAVVRRMRGHKHTFLVLAATGGVLALYLVWLAFLPQPTTITTISALSERVEFTVIDPRLGSVPIGQMQLGGEGDYLEGLLEPQRGAIIAYERGISGKISVTLVSGNAVFHPKSGDKSGVPVVAPADFLPAECTVADSVPAERCRAQSLPSRFPIWGELRIGDEMRPTSDSGNVQTGLLLEGQIKVQARAIEHWLVLSYRPSLYPVTTMDLPPGARIEASDQRPEKLVWWGTVYKDDQKVGLQVQVGTEASSLKIFRPGRTDPDVIAFSVLTQIFSDPNLLRAQALVGGFFAVHQIMSLIIPNGHKDEPKPRRIPHRIRRKFRRSG